ncbi:MAG: HAD hydrolase-like protein, partial [Pseudomonadota bacterium]|nr:HAD hydrolase-like protein [Pseudomonadota bacterium]
MTQRVFDAFVFDLDGTLVDTASELIAAYKKLCIELGGGEKPFDDARKLISHGSGRLVTEATGIEEGDPRWEPYRQQYLDWYEELLGSTAKPYDGLVAVLKAAHSAGKK